MLENFVTDKFEYKKLSEAEQKARRILGRLTGVIAETKKPTRNGRGYSIELWENVFENPIMKEKIANRCCFGELNHPADRTEIDIEKVAICLAEQPKKSKDGRLYGVFDILDTPNGRILKTLCDYGCKIGISSRGQGDIITDLHEDMAAEQKARTTYDNILRMLDNPDVIAPIRFLRQREIVHFQRFGEALRMTQDKLDAKNFYAFNPGFDCKPSTCK